MPYGLPMKGKHYVLLAAVFFVAGIGQPFTGYDLADLVLFQAVNLVLYGLGTAFLIAFLTVNEVHRG